MLKSDSAAFFCFFPREQLSGLSALEELNLDGNRFGPRGSEPGGVPPVVLRLSSLRRLSLAGNLLAPENLPLGLASALPKLTELRL